jgi:hypothetical protein
MMVITDQDRLDLYASLGETIGSKEAATLMEHLPPGGWREVAMRSDVAVVRSELRGVEERLGLRIDGVEERLGLRIDGVEERLGLRIDGVEERLGTRLELTEQRLRTDLHQGLAGIQRDMRVQGFSLLGGVSVIVAVATAVGQLL